MELEQPKPENLDQLVNSELDHQQQQSGTSLSTATGQSISIVARSYECTFCKRGFSNAQALGGHMNIHRKDKAKLRSQASYSSNIFNQQHQQQAALDNIPKMPPSYSPIPVMSSSSETNPAGLPRRPPNWFLDHNNNNNNEGDTTTSKGTDHGDQVLHHHQLRLFDETPPPPPPPPSPDYNKDQNPDHSPPPHPHHHHYQVIDVKFEKGSELDLELRLGGPEPQDAPAAIGTRKFFY